MTSLEGLAQFGRDHGTPLAHALGFRRGKTPTKSTFSKLFRRLDIQAFEEALRRWTLTRQAEGWQMIDGKTLKGSADGVISGVHLLSAFISEAAAVLAQIRVDAKTKNGNLQLGNGPDRWNSIGNNRTRNRSFRHSKTLPFIRQLSHRQNHYQHQTNQCRQRHAFRQRERLGIGHFCAHEGDGGDR